MFYTLDGATATLRIKAQPAASRSEFAGVYGEDAIKIRLAAPAVEGAANKELIKFLSKQFKTPKNSFQFKSGETSKIKMITFPVTEKFQAWLETM